MLNLDQYKTVRWGHYPQDPCQYKPLIVQNRTIASWLGAFKDPNYDVGPEPGSGGLICVEVTDVVLLTSSPPNR